ncbi:MAG: DUF1877 family protein [Anaerolineales bacterium]|nr:DUF1877 family protein [Anaerolineales bacterium]
MVEAYLVRVKPEDLEAVAGNSKGIRQLITRARRQEGRFLNLGKAWAGIHYVLTAEPPIPKQTALQLGVSWDDSSLENVLMGGRPLAYRASFGPVRYLESEAVAILAQSLANLSGSQFEQWYDAKGLTEEQIPPGGWSESRREWLTTNFRKLQAFYSESALKNDGILILME